MPFQKKTEPAYQRAKNHLIELIKQHRHNKEYKLPSEHALMKTLLLSRMTINRAFRELAQEGLIQRINGVGSFIKPIQAESHPLQIINIADEIQQRGHQHSCKVLAHRITQASKNMAHHFDIAFGATLYYSRIIHFESHLPIQLEERYILPALAPDYLEQDFSNQTTNAYLLTVAANIQKVEQTITANNPNNTIKAALNIPLNTPCLVLQRKTWVKNSVMTFTQCYHDASCYQFTSNYQPTI